MNLKNENDKLEMLKEYYLNLEHPHWKREQWEKKIENIFLEIGLRGKFSVEEYLIRTLELCYTQIRGMRVKYDILSYTQDGEEKEKLRKEIETIEEKRLELFNKRVKERLDWYYSLK